MTKKINLTKKDLFLDLNQPSFTDPNNLDINKKKENVEMDIQDVNIALWNCNLKKNTKLVWSKKDIVISGFPDKFFDNNFNFYIKHINKEDLEIINNTVSDAVNKKKKKFNTEYRITLSNGETRWNSAPGKIYYNRAKEPIKISGIIIDITNKKQIELLLLNKTHNLSERVKELNCLYSLSKIIEKPNISIKEILTKTIELIPPSWQYPPITCSRIVYKNKEYRTDNYQKTEWRQRADIFIDNKYEGFLEVLYLEKRPDIDEGPFLKEERLLIDALSKHLSRALERKTSEEKLNTHIKQLSLNAKVGFILTNKNKLNIMLNLCCKTIAEHLKPILVRIWTIDKTNKKLNLQANAPENSKRNKKNEIYTPDTSSIIFKILKEKKEFFSDNLNTIEHLSNQEWIKKEKINSYSGYPLMVSNQALGAVEVFSKKKINKDNLETLRSISQKIALGISQKWSENEQLKLHKELRALTAHLQLVQEREKKNLARELHDELGQFLTAINLEMYNLKEICNYSIKKKELSNANSVIGKITKLMETTMNITEKMVMNLRPVILDDLGLMAALKWLVNQISKHSKIACKFETNLDSLTLNQEKSIALYRIIQENITNISRHSQATKMEVVLKKVKTNIHINITDNGIGFNQKELKKPKSFGILGMKERAYLFGWELNFKSVVGSGTTVSLIIPKGDINDKSINS